MWMYMYVYIFCTCGFPERLEDLRPSVIYAVATLSGASDKMPLNEAVFELRAGTDCARDSCFLTAPRSRNAITV